MGPFRTIALAVLIVLFTINLMGVYLGFILNGTILQPTFFIRTFDEQEGYAQIRQLMFRMVNRNLPNGQDSLPYLEKAISEDWLEGEINLLLKNFYSFAKGKRNDTPTITFQALKKQVVDALEDSRSFQDRTRLVQFWFEPLPDEVNLEDFMSIDFIWGVRNAVVFIKWLPWIICGSSIIIILLMYVTILDWKQLILWVSVGFVTVGALLIFLGLTAEWTTGRMSIVMDIVGRFISYEIPENSANNFVGALVRGVVRPINICGIISILAGGTALYLVPVEERILTLVK